MATPNRAPPLLSLQQRLDPPREPFLHIAPRRTALSFQSPDWRRDGVARHACESSNRLACLRLFPNAPVAKPVAELRRREIRHWRGARRESVCRRRRSRSGQTANIVSSNDTGRVESGAVGRDAAGRRRGPISVAIGEGPCVIRCRINRCIPRRRRCEGGAGIIVFEDIPTAWNPGGCGGIADQGAFRIGRPPDCSIFANRQGPKRRDSMRPRSRAAGNPA